MRRGRCILRGTAVQVWAVILFCAISAAHADNGRVAWAFPATGITIDGDLSDWPTDLPDYPIELTEYGEPPRDAADLSATMQVAYDHDDPNLYVAVRVVDDSAVLGSAPLTEWENRDGLEIYVGLDRTAPQDGFRSVQEALFGDSHYSTFSESRAGDDLAPTAKIIRQVTEDGYVYEARIDLRHIAPGAVQWALYTSIAFDVAVNDRDEDGSFSWVAWGPFVTKLRGEDRLGDVLLVDHPIDLNAALERTASLQAHSVTETRTKTGSASTMQAFAAGVLGAVAMIHLLLQGFGVQRRANLYYALATAFAGVMVYVSLLGLTGSAGWFTNDLGWILQMGSLMLAAHFSLHFLYTIFSRRVPRWYWPILVTSVVAPTLPLMGDRTIQSLVDMSLPLLAFTILSLAAEALRVVVTAVWRRQEGARTIALGVVAFLSSGFGLFAVVAEPTLPLVLVFLSPIAAVSVHLARNVALTSRQLDTQNQALSEANRQIEEATRNKSQFLRRMSHDLRSPMNAIIGYSRLLRRRLADRMDEREARNLANIETSSGNLLNLINDILDLSRIEAGHVELNLQSVDVKRLTEECADALESIVHENVVLRRDLVDVGVINSDPDRLRQVVMNLLGNATKFTEVGSITLSLKRVPGGAPPVDTSTAGSSRDDLATGSDTQLVEISIADTGIGIPAQDLPHIFDEFRQVERQGGEAAEGTGLGLAIARKTVELLGGEISAISEVGVGTTFTVRLNG